MIPKVIMPVKHIISVCFYNRFHFWSFLYIFCYRSFVFNTLSRYFLPLGGFSLFDPSFLWFPAPLHGFAFWFDVEFSGPAVSPSNNHTLSLLVDNNPIDGSQRKKRANPNEALVLSTAPEDPPTHWQQVLIMLAFLF